LRTLAEHIRIGSELPFGYGAGEYDCARWPCDWVLEQTGVDPAAPVRDQYTTELGCARHIARNGGFLELVSKCMDGAGLDRTVSPISGDVGVVFGGNGETLAIRGKAGWFGKGQDGVYWSSDVECVRAWSVPCLR
jgi:hypothetical protein